MSNAQGALVVGLLVIVLFFALGFTLVEAGHVGAVRRLKAYHRRLLPEKRFQFVIPLIDQVEYSSTQTMQHEFPTEPELIDRTNEIPEEGKKPPFRVVHKGLKEAYYFIPKTKRGKEVEIDPDNPLESFDKVRYSDLPKPIREAMLTDSVHAALTSEIAVVVEESLGLTDKDLQHFIENVNPAEGRTREEEVAKRMEDMVSNVLQEYLTQVTLGHAIERKDLFDALLKQRLDILVGRKPAPGQKKRAEKPWGRNVGSAYIKSFHPGHTVNKARADAAASISAAVATVTSAKAQKEATELAATADAFKRSEEGRGKAAALGHMAEAMKEGGDHALALAQLDVAREVLPKANTIIMPSDLGALGGILTLGSKSKSS